MGLELDSPVINDQALALNFTNEIGFGGSVQEAGWRFVRPEPGQRLQEPEPLYKKLDPSVVEEEEARLGV
jgi:hypothetical protein